MMLRSRCPRRLRVRTAARIGPCQPSQTSSGRIYASPLLVVVLAAVVLRERVQGYRWAGVIVGFLGVLIMLA
jgi:hypothetical protein